MLLPCFAYLDACLEWFIVQVEKYLLHDVGNVSWEHCTKLAWTWHLGPFLMDVFTVKFTTITRECTFTRPSTTVFNWSTGRSWRSLEYDGDEDETDHFQLPFYGGQCLSFTSEFRLVLTESRIVSLFYHFYLWAQGREFEKQAGKNAKLQRRNHGVSTVGGQSCPFQPKLLEFCWLLADRFCASASFKLQPGSEQLTARQRLVRWQRSRLMHWFHLYELNQAESLFGGHT